MSPRPRENYHDDDLRALTDAEHALTSVAAFCHFYGLPVPKIWPLSFAKRNTLVSKTRKHDTGRERGREKAPRSGARIIRLSCNPLSSTLFRSRAHALPSSAREHLPVRQRKRSTFHPRPATRDCGMRNFRVREFAHRLPFVISNCEARSSRDSFSRAGSRSPVSPKT